MKLRRVFFWMHLCVGVAAGVVIFIMSATGVVLAFEKQINAFANREYRVTPDAEQQALPLAELLARVSEAEGKPASGLTLRPEGDDPVEVSYGREAVAYVDPYTGAILGESHKLPAFFATVENLHRWLGASDAARNWGKGITGACTLGFVGLTLSGPFLWWPREWTASNLKKISLFRGGLRGRALYWNWHNVLGIWCVAPLFLIALTGVIMSYTWANDLLYRMTGNEPPAVNAPQRQQDRGNRPGGSGKSQAHAVEAPAGGRVDPLEVLVARAASDVPGWKTLQVRLPNGRGPMMAFVDAGSSGRPDQRSQFAINSQTGEIRGENFASYNAGRRLRAWARFSHTGEAGGWLGQTVAALASLGAAVLAFSGIVLSLKRLAAWRGRSRPSTS